MKYLFLLFLLGMGGWLGYQHLRRKWHALRGDPEPVHVAPRSVKLLAAGIVAAYGTWIVFRLWTSY